MMIGFVVIIIAAYGQKSAEDIIETGEKDSHTGYSEKLGTGYLFRAGDDVLTFNKKIISLPTSMER